jgi:hypothetical protein
MLKLSLKITVSWFNSTPGHQLIPARSINYPTRYQRLRVTHIIGDTPGDTFGKIPRVRVVSATAMKRFRTIPCRLTPSSTSNSVTDRWLWKPRMTSRVSCDWCFSE